MKAPAIGSIDSDIFLVTMGGTRCRVQNVVIARFVQNAREGPTGALGLVRGYG